MVIIAACSSSAHQLLDLLSDRKSFLPLTACSPARLFRREQCYAGGCAPHRYSARSIVLSDPAMRSARGNDRRRRASSRHVRLGCRYAPRPGSRACGSGWMTSPTATRRSRLDFSARSLQPTQVRMTGIPEACRSDRTASPGNKSTVSARLRHPAKSASAGLPRLAVPPGRMSLAGWLSLLWWGSPRRWRPGER